MKMDTQRLILLFIFSFSLLMLWEAWDKQGRPKPPPPAPAAQGVPAPAKPAAPEAAGKPAAPGAPATGSVPGAEATAKGETVRVTTDLLVAEIDTLGGTLSASSFSTTRIRRIRPSLSCSWGQSTTTKPKAGSPV